MRVLAVLVLITSAAWAGPDEEWTKKYPDAATGLSAITKKMKLGTSNFGAFVEKNPEQAKKLAELLRKPQKPDPSIDDKMEDLAEKNNLEALTRLYGTQMTFPAFSKAFYTWAKKYPDAATALLTTQGVARPIMPVFDESAAANEPPPQSAEEAAAKVFGGLEEAGTDRLEKYDDYKQIASLPKGATSGELHQLFLGAAKDFFSKSPYMKNEDNARQEVLAVIVTSKNWNVHSEPTDLYEDKLGRKMQMMHRTLGAAVVVRRDKTQCMVFLDAIFERRRQDETEWSGVNYSRNGKDETGRKIDCAKIK